MSDGSYGRIPVMVTGKIPKGAKYAIIDGVHYRNHEATLLAGKVDYFAFSYYSTTVETTHEEQGEITGGKYLRR